MRRNAFTLIEALIVAVLAGVALVSLIGAGSSIDRQTVFNEHHILALGRARLVLDLASALDFEVYAALTPDADKDVEVPLDKLLAGGGLGGLYAPSPDLTDTSYFRRLRNVREKLIVRRLDDVTAVLRAEIDWELAADQKKRGIVMERLTHRREVGLIDGPLRR